MIPKVVDLFSGCGGLTLGFKKAGFDIIAGIELMKVAVDTISYNLDYRFGREASHICGDITQINSKIFKDKIGKEGCIVIGGPPCQAYSIAGRGKLNSLGKNRDHTKDARGFLYKDFIRFGVELNARAIIMENVPEATNFGGLNVPEKVCSELEKYNYEAYWTILNSADYGVPQVRERIILIAIKKDEKSKISLPIPTNTNRDISSNWGRVKTFLEYSHFKIPEKNLEASPWVTVGEALSDLPILFQSAYDKYKNVPLTIAKEYSKSPQNKFQIDMRNWFGSETERVTGNSFRNNERDFRIFERMKQGDNYVNASEIADELFEDETKLFNIEENSMEYIELKRKRVPIYDRENFCSKWRKLREDMPSHTLVAHLSKDTYSHLHPWEPRGISVREAARLQSFPDDFIFSCSMGDAYKQIGNAVPPLMAYGVAKVVYKAFIEEEYNEIIRRD